jgi:protocatechuate 3,4-dioxygenase beta subunit
MVSLSPPGPFLGQFGPPSPELSATQISASTNQTCQLTPSLIEEEGTPQQIEGPYFVDDMPNRSDIRSDPSDGSVQQGVPLRLALHVYDVDNGSCIPLSGAQVDV